MMTLKTQTHHWLAAIRLPGVGPVMLNHLVTHFGSAEHLFQAPRSEWQALNISDALIEALENPDWKTIETEIRWAEDPRHHIVTWMDEAYPPLLKEISDAPAVLYVNGDPTVLSERQMAMVGSRNPSIFGVEMAHRFANELSAQGFVITSGLALGIDGASHRGALAANGRTIAVLGSGLNSIYPKRHVALAEEIAERGALVSEFYLAFGPQADNFPRRNRIISGLSVGTLVVEAALCSGSLITARYANEQGRDVFALPGSLSNPLSRGGHALIKDGAKLVENVEDITGELGHFALPLSHSQRSVKEKLDPEQQHLLHCMAQDVSSVDILVARSAWDAGKVLMILTELELSHYIESVPGGYIAR